MYAQFECVWEGQRVCLGALYIENTFRDYKYLVT